MPLDIVEIPLEERQKRAWDALYSRGNPAWRGPPEVAAPFNLGNSVLELGCGNGKTLRALRTAKTIVAIDFSLEAIRLCSNDLEFKEVELVLGDVRELPFVAEGFDSVFCVHVLEHLSEVDRLLLMNEIGRVLVTDGNLFVRAFSTEDMRAEKGEIVEKGSRMRGDGIAYHYFHESELASFFEGFEIASLRKVVNRKRFEGREYKREVFEVHATKIR